MKLDLVDIRLSFTNARNETFNLLNGVNLGVEEGNVSALIGGNGSGKTTLFNVISGFQENYSGHVYLNGKCIDRWPVHKISLNGVGRMFQGRQLMSDLTLMENMKVAAWDRTGERPFESIVRPRAVSAREMEKEQKAIATLKQLYGEDNKYLGMLDMKAGGLSYGEQRLIALASLLMGEDDLLLLDEPTAGVNPMYIETIGKVIRMMVEQSGCTILLIEHNMHFVRQIADTCSYLDEGIIKKTGSVEDILDDEVIRNSYLG